MQSDEPGEARYYLLPKILKVGNPRRPIVSANGQPTENISELIDLHLLSNVQDLPYYLRDTTDLLRKQDVIGPLPPDTLLCFYGRHIPLHKYTPPRCHTNYENPSN